MANDILLSSGTGAGATLATDANASTEHYQLIKVAYGLLSSNYQLVSTAAPYPVVLGSSSAAIGLSSGTVTLSSNPTVISASSGLIQTLSSGAILLSSAGVSQVIFPVTSTAGFGPVTSSGGQLVSISSGTVTLSSATSLSSGTVTLSSNPTVISASSGLIQLTSAIALSSGTVTLSSNPTVISASSGIVQMIHLPFVTSSGLQAAFNFSTGGAVAQVITTNPASLYGWAYFNTSATIRGIKVYNSTGPTVGSTANLLLALGIPGSTGGGGANVSFPVGIAATGGLSIVFTANVNGTDTGSPGANNDLVFNTIYMV